jgi:hypothetical protein
MAIATMVNHPMGRKPALILRLIAEMNLGLKDREGILHFLTLIPAMFLALRTGDHPSISIDIGCLILGGVHGVEGVNFSRTIMMMMVVVAWCLPDRVSAQLHFHQTKKSKKSIVDSPLTSQILLYSSFHLVHRPILHHSPLYR